MNYVDFVKYGIALEKRCKERMIHAFNIIRIRLSFENSGFDPKNDTFFTLSGSNSPRK